MEYKNKKICILDLFVLFVSVYSIVNVFLLIIKFFYPLLGLLISIAIVILYLIISKRRVNFDFKRFHWLLLIILLIAVGFRLFPNLYLTGGQDQGTYVSLSKQYEINHSLYIKDQLRDSLSSDLKQEYDNGNKFLGINLLNESESTYVMPFYPVFPSWMSVFGNFFGSDNRVYALTFFSILSIIGMYLLGYEISGRNKKVGLLTSLLLAVNPLHVYFSRVPVTEIMALTFTLFSIYYLLKFYNDYKLNKVNYQYMIISLLSVNALFYTRMSGIFLLPIIVLFVIVAFIFNKNKKNVIHLFIYLGLWILSLFLSYVFYKICIPDLFKLILGRRLLNLVGIDLLVFLFIIFIGFLILLVKNNKFQFYIKKILNFFKNYFYIFVLAIFIGLILYELYFYIKDIFVEKNLSFFSIESLSSFKQLSFITTILYLSPLGFILLPVSFIYQHKKIDWRRFILFFFLLVLLLYYWGVLRDTPYQYYFARYQISELIPLCLLLISITLITFWESKIGRIVSICAMSVICLYSGYFSIIQLREKEGLDKEIVSNLANMVGEENILLVDKEELISSNQIIFPLKYYYNIKTISFNDIEAINNSNWQKELNKYENIYLLTTKNKLDNAKLTFKQIVDFKNNYLVHCLRSTDEFFVMENHSKDIPFCEYIIIPNRFYYGTYRMYLYKWE